MYYTIVDLEVQFIASFKVTAMELKLPTELPLLRQKISQVYSNLFVEIRQTKPSQHEQVQ